MTSSNLLAPVQVHALVEELLKLDILEFSDLSKLLARKLGLPENPMMGGMMMAGGGAPAAGAPAAAADAPPAEEEKTSFTVKLDGFDASSKIKVIKEIRAITQLGLKEAKELVRGPLPILPLLLPPASSPAPPSSSHSTPQPPSSVHPRDWDATVTIWLLRLAGGGSPVHC